MSLPRCLRGGGENDVGLDPASTTDVLLSATTDSLGVAASTVPLSAAGVDSLSLVLVLVTLLDLRRLSSCSSVDVNVDVAVSSVGEVNDGGPGVDGFSVSAILSTDVRLAPSAASCDGILAAVTAATPSPESTAASADSLVAAGTGTCSDVEGDLVGILAADVAVEEGAEVTEAAAAFFCPALAAASAPSCLMVWFNNDDSAGLVASLSLVGSEMEM